MNAMKRLIIENFQSHEKTIIEPAPPGHLTVITGPSDSGKTVIFRSNRWLSCNEPDGIDFIRAGASFARVTEELESGHSVVRHRTAGGVNRYIIVSPDSAGERQTLEGFGRGSVPLEVQELVGVRPVTIGDIKFNLNLAEQLDGPFLGSSVSAPGRAKVLGKLAGTEEIDHAGKMLGTDLHRRNQDEKKLTGELKELDADIAEYDYLPIMAERIHELEHLVTKVKTAQERRNKLVTLKTQLVVVEEKWLECQGILQHWHCLEFAEPVMAKVEANRERSGKLWDLRDHLGDLDYSIYECQEIRDAWRGVDEAVKVVNEAEKAKARKQETEWHRDRLVKLDDAIADCQGTIDAWNGAEQADLLVIQSIVTLQDRKRTEKCKDALVAANSAIRSTQSTLNRLQGIDEAEDIVNGILGKVERRQTVGSLLKRYQNIKESIEVAETILVRLAGVTEAERQMTNAFTLSNRRSTVYGSAVELRTMERLVKEYGEQVVLLENRVAELQGAYADELVTLGICPTCGNKVDSKKLKEAC